MFCVFFIGPNRQLNAILVQLCVVLSLFDKVRIVRSRTVEYLVVQLEQKTILLIGRFRFFSALYELFDSRWPQIYLCRYKVIWIALIQRTGNLRVLLADTIGRLVSSENISSIDLCFDIVQTGVITIGDDGRTHLLEFLEIVNYLTAEEC